MIVQKSGDEILNSVYRKHTNTRKYLKYDSYHPEHIKFGVAQRLFWRAGRIPSIEIDKCEEIKRVSDEFGTADIRKKNKEG